jgi:ABC-type bacteriocin/lantibiotic exporter with double-glycine peptidase domain
LRGVEFRYRDGDDAILSAIDLEIGPGSTVALVGRSGSGKSTLLWLIGGLVEPSAGTITVGSVDMRALRRRELRDGSGTCSRARTSSAPPLPKTSPSAKTT